MLKNYSLWVTEVKPLHHSEIHVDCEMIDNTLLNYVSEKQRDDLKPQLVISLRLKGEIKLSSRKKKKKDTRSKFENIMYLSPFQIKLSENQQLQL